MKEFKDKVAVITGAASGIGRAIASRCAQEGMKVVLTDIEEKALTRTETEMKALGATVLAVLTDVSKASDLEALAQKTLDAFGAVHLLCNNAGVDAGTSIWESTLADWQWVMGLTSSYTKSCDYGVGFLATLVLSSLSRLRIPPSPLISQRSISP